MNSDEARNILDSKLSQMGYIHPTETVSNRSTQYMAYSISEEEKIGNYITQKPYDPYAIVNTEEEVQPPDLYPQKPFDPYINFYGVEEIQNPVLCPVCKLKPEYSCSCSFKDMMCDQGHIWTVLKNGNVKIGDPHV